MLHWINTWMMAATLLCATAGAAAIEATYSLQPTGNGELTDVIGTNAAISASTLFDHLKDKWNIAVAKIETDASGNITNISDLIPTQLIVVPDTITVHAMQVRGSKSANHRQDPKTGAVRPAEESFFVFALNKDHKLIPPLAPRMEGTAGRSPMYSVLPVTSQLNHTYFSEPLVAGSELDVAGVYDDANPDSNPPYAMMVHARTPGTYSVSFIVRYNNNLVPASASKEIQEKARSSIATASASVHVVDGIDVIDRLLLTTSPSQGLHDADKPLKLVLTEGDVFNGNLSGLVFTERWGMTGYTDSAKQVVTLREMTWKYQNLSDSPNMPPLISIRKLAADGTAVQITANKPVDPKFNHGILRIEGHGRQFEIQITVNPKTGVRR